MSWPRTCGARSSSPSRRCCRWSTWSSPTAATTPPPSASTIGKPMIVLPLFWDQYDNAQRVDETGFGVRLPTYTFGPSADLRDRWAGGRRRSAPAHGGDRRSPAGRPGHGAGGRPDRACRRRRLRSSWPSAGSAARPARSHRWRSRTGSSSAPAPPSRSCWWTDPIATSGARARSPRPSPNRGLAPVVAGGCFVTPA